MKIVRRQDRWLIAALTAAMVIVFSSTISRGLDYVREIERQSGLTLMPALVLLVVAFVFHLYRRNQLESARTLEAQLATREAEHRAEDLERLVQFGQAVGVLGVRPHGPLPADRRRVLEAAAALLAVSVKNAQLFREVKENSVKDPLTGCFTKAHSMDVIDAELRRARRSQTPVSMIMFDIDHFKDVNDRHGHLCGDAVLSVIGKRMKDVLRGSDLKCRYGGEEFLVLLPETPLHGARRVAETLRREIAERPVHWAGETLTITASFGLAQTLPGEVNVEAVIARADQALYRAKDDGRNCVRIAADSPTLVADDTTRHNRIS